MMHCKPTKEIAEVSCALDASFVRAASLMRALFQNNERIGIVVTWNASKFSCPRKRVELISFRSDPVDFYFTNNGSRRIVVLNSANAYSAD